MWERFFTLGYVGYDYLKVSTFSGTNGGNKVNCFMVLIGRAKSLLFKSTQSYYFT